MTITLDPPLTIQSFTWLSIAIRDPHNLEFEEHIRNLFLSSSATDCMVTA